MLLRSNDSAVPGDVKFIFDSFNELMKDKNIPMIRSIQGSRLRMVRARLSRYGESSILEAFRNAAESDFLQGSTGLKVTFDWLIKPDNFQKVLEGNYKNKDYGKSKGKEARDDSGLDSRKAEIERLDAEFKTRKKGGG